LLTKTKAAHNETMSSDEDEYDDEEPSQTSNNESLNCGGCISYHRQRDNLEKEKEELNKKYERENELREEGERELKRLKDKVFDVERINKQCIDALSEVVEKMFYCEKDEGGASIKGGKKGTKHFPLTDDACLRLLNNLTILFPRPCCILQLTDIPTSQRWLMVTLTLLPRICSKNTSSSTARA
jgi:hypothetical protein